MISSAFKVDGFEVKPNWEVLLLESSGHFERIISSKSLVIIGIMLIPR